jgi:hypothetical protein
METANDLTIRVQDLVNDENLTKGEKIKALYGLYDHARAEQRAASESPMIDDDGLNDSLSNIEKALAEFGEQPSSHDNGAATL